MPAAQDAPWPGPPVGAAAPEAPSLGCVWRCPAVGSREPAAQGAPAAVRVRLEAPSRTWRVGEAVELRVQVENGSGRPVFARLGAYSDGTDDGAVVAAAGLRSRAAGALGEEAPWSAARVLQPRALPREREAALRERALYLPAGRSAVFELRGRAVAAHGIGHALRLGGGHGGAEVLLPLPSPGGGSAGGGPAQAIRVELGGPGGDLPGGASTPRSGRWRTS
ncbi:unnamed protein product, partial [Prorocentrum cordatum]